MLLNYRDILIQSRIVKDKNNIINEITNFNLHNFKKTKSFFDFLQNLVPQLLKFNYKDFIQLKIGVKRDAGIFQKWRNTILIVTYQGHILLLDEDKTQPVPSKSNEAEKKESNIDPGVNSLEKRISDHMPEAEMVLEKSQKQTNVDSRSDTEVYNVNFMKLQNQTSRSPKIKP